MITEISELMKPKAWKFNIQAIIKQHSNWIIASIKTIKNICTIAQKNQSSAQIEFRLNQNINLADSNAKDANEANSYKIADSFFIKNESGNKNFYELYLHLLCDEE